jgi:hypothetical protein
MDPSQPTKFKENINTVEEYLVDKDKDIFYLSYRSTLLSYTSKVNHNFRDLVDHYHAWESDLAEVFGASSLNLTCIDKLQK